MNSARIGLVAGLVVAVLAGGAPADIPRLINYQGRVTDAKGVPIHNEIALDLAIFDTPTAGKNLFTESHTKVVATQGIFHVLIGSRTVGGVPSSVFADGERYVQVSVNGEILGPRQRLAAVPYAYVAETAQAFEVPLHITAGCNDPMLWLTNTGRGPAIYAEADDGGALIGSTVWGDAVSGLSLGSLGLYAHSQSGIGAGYLLADGSGSWGVKAVAAADSGGNVGVIGEAVNSPLGIGVRGTGKRYGVEGVGLGGPGGHFVSEGGIAVQADGTVNTDKIAYNQPREHYLSVSSCAFHPRTDVAFSHTIAMGGAYVHSGTSALTAPVYLPDRAAITSFTAYLSDTSATNDLTVELNRQFPFGGYMGVASVTSATSGGNVERSVTLDPPHVVRNDLWAYLLFAYNDAWSDEIRILSVRITYTLDEAP